jgi:hypothetical protein
MAIKAELAWCAGLYDAEGCTTIGKQDKRRYVHLTLNQKEPAGVLEKFGKIIGVGRLHGPYARQTKTGKLSYRWDYQIQSAAQIDRALGAMWPFMGSVKQKQALFNIGKQTSKYRYTERELMPASYATEEEALSWAGGFYSGDGSSYLSTGLPYLSASQKHEEVLERLKSIMGVGCICGPYTRKEAEPQEHEWLYWITDGSEVRYALKRIWPYLSEVKKDQVRKLKTKSALYSDIELT